MNHGTRITVLIALLLAVGVTSALAANAGSTGRHATHNTETLRYFSKDVSTTVTRADGTVLRKPPFPEPQPGDTLDINALDYVGNHRHHAKRFSASHHLQCVFTSAEPQCISHVAVGGSLLIFEGFPGTLINGTGRYQGASGRVLKNKEVKGGSDIVARIHTR
jgi:hypothetical protein